jgi:hypothetical protein
MANKSSILLLSTRCNPPASVAKSSVADSSKEFHYIKKTVLLPTGKCANSFSPFRRWSVVGASLEHRCSMGKGDRTDNVGGQGRCEQVWGDFGEKCVGNPIRQKNHAMMGWSIGF